MGRQHSAVASNDRSVFGYQHWIGPAPLANLLRDGYMIRIFLNEQAHCLIADPDEGWIMRYRLAGGKPVFVGRAAQTEIVKGNISIRLERQFRSGDGGQ